MMIVQAKNDKLSLLKWEMLTSVLKALVKNLIKKSFYGKRKKKTINNLTVFFISHKSDVKTFFNWIINQCPKSTHLHDLFEISVKGTNNSSSIQILYNLYINTMNHNKVKFKFFFFFLKENYWVLQKYDNMIFFFFFSYLW